MEWRDEGLVIGVKRHGESSAIIELLTRAHGRHLGLVRGGRSARSQSALQPGNSLGLVWRARLDEHLGSFAVEPLKLRAGRLIVSALALAGLGYLGALLRLLPERDPHQSLHDALEIIADHLDMADVAPPLLARFEMQVLAECGFRLDLERCAATGARDELIYVSPKTGRAVSASAGAPWRDKLLALPAFLRADGSDAALTPEDVADAFRLTGFFLERNLFGPRGLPVPDARRAFLVAAAKPPTP
jgi:DNA repair protein RecO (recombination protein O)